MRVVSSFINFRAPTVTAQVDLSYMDVVIGSERIPTMMRKVQIIIRSAAGISSIRWPLALTKKKDHYF